MSEDRERPTGVERLVIYGRAGWYSIMWRNGEGRLVSVDAGEYAGLRPNTFARVRDAKAAALRLSPVLPWGQDELGLERLTTSERQGLRVRIVEALTGRTSEELEQEYEEKRRVVESHHRGDYARENLRSQTDAAGHDVWTINRSGLRSWVGKCSKCKGTVRASYMSMSDTYNYTVPPCTREN